METSFPPRQGGPASLANQVGAAVKTVKYKIRGVYPKSLAVKKGIPVDLTIDNKVPLGGCMSVWIIPKYNVTIPMKVGTLKTNFTPTETGTIALTCSMGSLMAQFSVIN